MKHENSTIDCMNILVVDDKPENLFSLEILLRKPDLNLVKATSGEEALRKVLKNEIALILMDVQMPGMNGYETAELLRSNFDTRYIPIIFVTAISKEEKHVFKGYESGAVDYLFKPLDPVILNSKVSIFLDLYRQKKMVEAQNVKLNEANKKILEQQKALIEEERLKVVLQMAGAAAHELSQPLMVLLGNIKLIEMDPDDPKKALKYISSIKDAGQKLSKIVKKIQILDHVETISHDSRTQILNLDREIKVLSVEDDDADFNRIVSILEKEKVMCLFRERTIKSTIERLARESFDIILLDFSLPDGTGLDLLRMMNLRKDATPVICLTGKGSETIATTMIREGAYDYLAKAETNRETILSIIKNTLDKYRLKQNIDTAMEKMAAMSTRDELTGLYNRRYMNELLEQEFNRAMRYDTNLSCLLMDLDLFKQVNDKYGHTCGDFVLKEFAVRLEQNRRGSDSVFRYGGEEFLMLLPQTDIHGAHKAGEAICNHCRNVLYPFETHQLNITISIGAASIESCRPSTGADLIAFADKALYRAKADGRNCVRIFEREKEHTVLETVTYGKKGINYLKDQVAVILEKTKQASMRALELLIKEIGGDQLENETRQTIQYIHFLGHKLNLPQGIVQSITQAASMNGCFRILLGEEILMKSGELTDTEKDIIEKLPYMKIELAGLFDFFTNEKLVLLYNHERYDGKGYPEGLKSNEIPLGARILSITNAVTAMTSHRSYRSKLDPEAVLSELVENAGSQFDPILVDLFIDIIAENKILMVSKQVLSRAKGKLEQSKIKGTK